MNNTEYKELIEKLNNIEAIAYGYNINGEVFGMDCSDFEQIMVDSAVAMTELMEILAKVTAERDAAVSEIESIIAYGLHLPNTCPFCKNEQCKMRGGTEPCIPKWRGIQEVQKDE